MAAFAIPATATNPVTLFHPGKAVSPSLVPQLSPVRKRQRPPPLDLRMNSPERETAKQQREKIQNEEDDDEDERLQRDPVYVYREFGKVSAVAVLIGLVLFFYDILVSLWATTIGLIYALAVLFEVKGADTLFANIFSGSIRLWNSFTEGVRKGWSAFRREVQKGLKD